MSTLYPYRNLQRVYCAGPLFNEAERREMLRVAYVLQRGGFETFVPHSDGMEFAEVLPYLVEQGFDPQQTGQLLHEAVFALDVYQVAVDCGSLVFNMNGRVPDEGGVAESAIAWTLGKPVVLYKEDVRSAVAGRDNPLLVGQTGFSTTNDLEALPSLLRDKIEEMSLDAAWQTPCPPHLERVITAGERLWSGLQQLGRDRSSPAVAEIILELFGPPAEITRV
ncbi:MAG: nucleoside 2-deoxyribosyltransferase [Pirellulales bacterium]